MSRHHDANSGANSEAFFLALLQAAKAFLCWDALEGLSIQLIPQQSSVGYFYPPGSIPAIVLFYDPMQQENHSALSLLFHEAGHAEQWRRYNSEDQRSRFFEMMQRDHGSEKVDFESEAWCFGKELLMSFITRHSLPPARYLARYDELQHCSLSSYKA